MHALKADIKSISRLSSQAVFDSLRQSRDLRWVAPGLVLQAQPRPGDQAGAYGLCVSASKKISPLAVERNRNRRRLKAVAAALLPALAQPGMNYMVSARRDTLERPMTDLEADLRWCLKKLNLLRAAPDDTSHAPC